MPPVQLRPSWPKQLRLMRQRRAPIILGAMAVLAVLSAVTGVDRVWGLTVLGTLLAMAAYLSLRQRNQCLFLRDGVLGTVSWLGIRRTFSIATLDHVDRVSLAYRNTPPTPHLVFVARTGQALFRTPDVIWADNDLDALWVRIGLRPTGSYDRVLSRPEYAAAYLHLRPYSALDALIAIALTAVGILLSLLIAGLVIQGLHAKGNGADAFAFSSLCLGVLLSSLGATRIVRRRRRLPLGVSDIERALALRAAAKRAVRISFAVLLLTFAAGLGLTALGIASVRTHDAYAAARFCEPGAVSSTCREDVPAMVAGLSDQGRGSYQVKFSGRMAIPDAFMASSTVAQLDLYVGEEVVVELWNGSVTGVETSRGMQQTFATQADAWVGALAGSGIAAASLVFIFIAVRRRARRV